jgi:hypothetical protein
MEMSGDFSGINWSEVQSSDFGVIPAGEYKACLISSERKKTKSGDGEYLEMKWQVLDGQYTGRLLWSRHNLWNKSQTAVTIARQEIKQILIATSNLAAQNASDILNLPLIIKVKVETRRDSGEPSNSIGGWKAVKDSVQPSAPTAGKPAWAQ